MNLQVILMVLSLGGFLAYFLYKGGRRKDYLIGTLYLFPFLGLGATPYSFGNLSVFAVIAYIGFFACIKDFLFYNKRNITYLYLIIILIILLFIGSYASEFRSVSLFGVLSFIAPFIFCRLLLKEITENKEFLWEMIKALKFSAIVAGIFILGQMTIGMSFTFLDSLNMNVMDESSKRYPGFFMDSQFNGTYCTMVSYLFLINRENIKSPKLSNYISFCLVTILIILAGSRSGLLAYGIGLVLLMLFVGGNFRPTIIAFLVAGAVVVYVMADSITLVKRFNDVDDSVSFRAALWKDAQKIFKNNWTMGVGVNNYREYAKLHAQDQFILVDDNEIMFLDFPENGYLKIMVEFGLFAALILLFLLIGPIISLFNNYFKGRQVVLGLFFFAPVVAWFVSMSTVYNLGDSKIVVVLASYIVAMLGIATYPQLQKTTYE